MEGTPQGNPAPTYIKVSPWVNFKVDFAGDTVGLSTGLSQSVFCRCHASAGSILPGLFLAKASRILTCLPSAYTPALSKNINLRVLLCVSCVCVYMLAHVHRRRLRGPRIKLGRGDMRKRMMIIMVMKMIMWCRRVPGESHVNPHPFSGLCLVWGPLAGVQDRS